MSSPRYVLTYACSSRSAQQKKKNLKEFEIKEKKRENPQNQHLFPIRMKDPAAEAIA